MAGRAPYQLLSVPGGGGGRGGRGGGGGGSGGCAGVLGERRGVGECVFVGLHGCDLGLEGREIISKFDVVYRLSHLLVGPGLG